MKLNWLISRLSPTVAVAVLIGAGHIAHAQSLTAPDQGKLLLTGGAIEVDGVGGGGLVPWAMITGYGTRDSFGASVHDTFISTSDFRLNSYGVAVGVFDRVEFSFNHHDFTITSDGSGLPLKNVKIGQDIFGLKVRIIGDIVYDQGTPIPEISLGVMYKSSNGIKGGVITTLFGSGGTTPTGLNAVGAGLGAKHNDGVDFYVAVSKLFLAQSLFLNGTIRATKANEFGLLGFGGFRKNSYEPEFEGSAAYLVTRKIAVGGEIRTKPHNLNLDNEKAAWDLFIAWAPIKTVSLVAAYLNLGKILDGPADYSSTQAGPYISLQVGF